MPRGRFAQLVSMIAISGAEAAPLRLPHLRRRSRAHAAGAGAGPERAHLPHRVESVER